MRIIAGRFRSRKLHSPADDKTTRPIPDRVKESLFGLLRGHFEGAAVLDAFAGTGSIGLEAISRGAERVVFVERDRRAADLLTRNVETLGVEDECEIVRSDALGPAALARCPKPVDLVFFDPPYPVVLDPEAWPRVAGQFERVIGLLSDGGFAVLRTPWPFRHVEWVLPDGRREWRSPLDRTVPGTEKKEHGGRRGREVLTERAWEGDEVDIEEIEEQTAADLRDLERGAGENFSGDAGGVPPDFQKIRHDVDLTFPNAEGPETHVYASMAVHLYMRKKSTAQEPVDSGQSRAET